MELYIRGVMSNKGVRYYVDGPEGRLHILNQNSLKWNLKRVFGMNSDQIRQVFDVLLNQGEVRVRYDRVA